jgi:hypothetical protein
VNRTATFESIEVEEPRQQAIHHSFELMRFGAAAGIVWFHMNPLGGHALAAALALFLILMGARRRLGRALRPWTVRCAAAVGGDGGADVVRGDSRHAAAA